MPPAFDLTGDWLGHYVQRDQPRGLVAAFRQDGERLAGTMRDLETEFERSVFDLAAQGGLPPGADEQIVSHLRSQFPDQAEGPIRAASSLPPESALEGAVRGDRVEFLKTYQGEAFTGFAVGRRRVGVTTPGHSVHYAGKLSPEGDALEGVWWIDADPERGTRRTEGTFLLRRRESGD